MSQPIPEIDERLYEMYVQECRTTATKPSLSDYSVWLSEQDLDEETYYDEVA